MEDNFPRAIYFISKNISKVNLNYTVTENELFAMVHALYKFRNYIIGYPTFIETDRATIKYLMNKPVRECVIFPLMRPEGTKEHKK